jgi:tetratricopeptide (TPR) repeat protein
MNIDKKDEMGQFKSSKLLLLIAIIGIAVAIAVGVYFSKTRDGSKEAVANREGTTQISSPQNEAKAKEHFESGVNYSLKKEYDKAIAEYLESLKYNPDVAAVHSNLAFAYFDKGNLDMAIQEHKKTIEIDPANSNAYYGMALIYENRGNKTEAIRYLEEFIKRTEPHSLWWNKAQERLEKLKSEK